MQAPVTPPGLADTGLEPEQRLQQLQRLAMMGTLASGIGHDVRNLVMPILLRLDVLAASTDLPERARSELASIREIVTHLQRLASGLRLLSADPFEQRVESAVTRFEQWWSDMHALIIDALPPHARLEADIPDVLPPLAIPPEVLAQVMINVVMNARRAMEDTPRPQLTVTAEADDSMLQLAVTDNGLGMDAETRLRCFEPFFTTRTRDFATGLGLSVGRALMSRYGGDLTLESTPVAGATFVLHVPVHHHADRVSAAFRRRVRLRLSDPRMTALLRLIVANKGYDETQPDDTDIVDVTICDANSLQQVMVDHEATLPPEARSRVVLVGNGVDAGVSLNGVIRVDPANMAQLSAVLD